MQVISLTNWQPFNDLERIFYEKRSYETLLGYMSANSIPDTNGYFQEYQTLMKEYFILCKRLEREIILTTLDEFVSWEVDFIDKCVKVRENTD